MKSENSTPVRTAAECVYNLIILDESGSMQAIKGPTLSGFNELLQSIRHSMKTTPEIEQWVSFYSFNGSGIREHLPLVHASYLGDLAAENYRPENSTPLFDAIGVAVNSLDKAIEKDTNYQVLVTILTDGEENTSKEYTHQAISGLIQDFEKKGWVFTYIGANHDVEKTARSLSINNYLRFHASEEGTRSMFSKNLASRANYINRLRKGDKNAGEGFYSQPGSQNDE